MPTEKFTNSTLSIGRKNSSNSIPVIEEFEDKGILNQDEEIEEIGQYQEQEHEQQK